MYKADLLLAPPILAACSYIIYKLIRELVYMKEDRPSTTDAMIEQAWRNMVMDDFDEFDEVDWESDLNR